MDKSGQQHTPPSDKDGDGVRVIAKAHRGRRYVVLYVLLALVMVGAGIAYLVNRPGPATTANAPAAEAQVAVAQRVDTALTTRRAAPPAPGEEPYEVPSRDSRDLAAHMRPGDPEPTAAELIDALHHAGIRSGIGAFNPPGTSPPLEGLAVPDDFRLPDGYVRHRQVTDEGVPIEPILMFSPDFILYDASGRPVAMPANRVVPPELAPPGLPLRRIRVPPR